MAYVADDADSRGSVRLGEQVPAGGIAVEAVATQTRTEPIAELVADVAPERALVVQVLDPEGRAVPRADLVLVASSEKLRAQTGVDGSATIARVPGGGQFLLRIAADGFYHHAARYGLEPGERELTATLQPSGVFRGRVVAARSGAGVPRAAVELQHAYCTVDCPRTAVFTDERGEFEMPAVPLGRSSHFRVVADGFPATGFLFDLPQEGVAELALGAGVTIAGTVRDALDGAPIEHAVVSTRDGVEEPVISDEDGEFRVLYVDRARGVRFLIAAPGYESLEYRVEAGSDASDLAVELEPLARLRGFVASPGGAPLAGAHVVARSTSHPVCPPPTDASATGDGSILFQKVDVASYYGEDVTGADGRFVLPGFPSEMSAARLSVTHEAILPVDQEVRWRASPGERVELRIESIPRPLSSIEGRLRIEGEVTPGVVILRRGDETRRCEVGPDGLYRFEGVPEGEVVVSASIPETRQVLAGSEHIAWMTPGDELRLDFDLAPSELELVGSVSDWDGSPVAGRQVSAVSCHGAMVDATRTDADGGFRLVGVSDATPYRILVRGTALAPNSTLAYAGGPPIDIRLPERMDVLLTLTRPDGETIPPVILTARVPGLPERVLYESLGPGVREHRFRLPSGEYHVDVRPEGLAPVSRRIRVGRDTRLDVSLDPGVPVELVAEPPLVLGAGLYLVPADQVEELRVAASVGWSPHAAWLTRSIAQYRVAFETQSGRARLAGLEPGRYEFFHDESITVHPQTIEVTPSMPQTVPVSVLMNDTERARISLSLNQD